MGTDSVIYIRTDGNSKIATGHLVRCLCIAQALESLGKTVCFLVSDQDSKTLLQDLAVSIFQGYSFSFDVKILETAAYDHLELEIDELKTLLAHKPANSTLNLSITISELIAFESTDSNINSINNFPVTTDSENLSATNPVIFIDSYYVTPNYLNFLSKVAKVAYMDDLRAFDYQVDLVINYDVIPPSREAEYIQAYTKASAVLLGAQYTPLRRQFQNQNVTLRENLENILITTGGSDPYHFTEDIISYLLSLRLTVNLHVVVGKLFTNIDSLEKLASEHPSVHLHYNVSDMAALMKQCDYAISAAGTTLYELCALGIPAITFTMADNQILMAETFAETEAVPYAGDIRPKTTGISKAQDNDSESPLEITGSSDKEIWTVLDCIQKHFLSLTQDSYKRVKQHQRMRSLVDGNGAIKIAEALLELCNSSAKD